MAGSDVTGAGRKARPLLLEGADFDLIVEIQAHLEHPFSQVEVAQMALKGLYQRVKDLQPRSKDDVINSLVNV